jgi:Tfp pilus assembly protein PilO
VKRVAARPAVLGLIACMVISAAWYRLLWTPQGASISAAHNRQKTAQTSLFTAEQRLGHLKKLASRAPQLTALDQRLTAALPDRDAIDQFLLDLNAEAAASNVTIQSLGVTPPGKTPSSGAAQAIALQLQFTGGYFDVQRFLGALRDGSRLVVIDQLALSGAATKQGSAPANGTMLQVTLSGRLFMTATAAPLLTFAAPASPAAAKSGTGVLETPINAARNAATSANNANAARSAAVNQAGGNP